MHLMHCGCLCQGFLNQTPVFTEAIPPAAYPRFCQVSSESTSDKVISVCEGLIKKKRNAIKHLDF